MKSARSDAHLNSCNMFLETFVRCGHAIPHPRNQAWRSLLPATYEFTLPLTRDGIHEYDGEHSCLLPHEVVHTLSKHDELFKFILTGDNLPDFWRGCRDSDWYQNHPLPQLRERPESCIPIRLYGDDAGVYENQKVLIINWCSACVTGTLTLDHRIIFTCLTYLRLVDSSISVVYKVLQWSLLWLALGEFPDRDHNGKFFSLEYMPERYRMRGQPLTASGFVGVFSELVSDWKYQVEALCLEYYYSTAFCCHLCRASKKIRRLAFTQYKRTDNIRRTLVTAKQFRDWLDVQDTCRSWVTLILGFSIFRCLVDAMHCLDLGVYQILVPCAIVELVLQGVWEGTTLEQRFALAYNDYSDWCRAEGLRKKCVFLWVIRGAFLKFET